MDSSQVSTDPLDATFSYQTGSQSLMGPFCCNCMNRWAGNFAAQSPMGIYIHYKSKGKLYKLEELFGMNGKETPFTFQRLEEEVRKYSCFYERCRIATISTPINGTIDRQIVEFPKLVTRTLPQSNPSYVTEKRPVEFPLLHGTSYRLCKAVTLEQWEEKSRNSMAIYNKITQYKKEVKEAFDALNWKTLNCDVCETVNPDEPYVEHVLSRQHFNKLCKARRWITLQHFDVLDNYCKKQEEIIKNGKKNTKEISALQQWPLLPMWNSPNTSQMSRTEFDEKLDFLANVLRTVDYRKLNEKNPLGIKREVCFWCGTWISDMSGILEHLLTRQHRDYLYEKTNVSIKDINGYINIVNQSKRLPSSPPPRNSLPRSSSVQSVNDSSLIRLPFLTGYENPAQPMSRDEVISLSIVAKNIIKDTPKLKSLLNEVLLQKGRLVQSCGPCNKKFPAAVSVLEHSVSIVHIDAITTKGLQFSRLYDFLPLVVILLDALKISHPAAIGVDDIEEYFSKIKKPTEKTMIPQEVKTPKYAEVKISKLEQPPMCPFLSPRSSPREPLTEEECLRLTKPLRAIICENDKVRKGILNNSALTNIKCFVCQKVFNSSFQIWEHVIAVKHIREVYAQNTSFCYLEDYLEAVRVLNPDKNVIVLADNVSDIVSRMESNASKPKYPNKPANIEVRATKPAVPSPSRSSSSASISSAQKVQGCKMIPNGRCLRFMTIDTKESSVLTEDQLLTLCRAVKSEICGIYRCYVSEYDRLGPVCPTDCPVCEYRALGCCDFVIHLFEDVHYNKLIESKVKVSPSDVQFWIDQLMALRKGCIKRMIPPADDAVSTCWATIGMSAVEAPSIESLNPSHYL